MWLSFLGLFVPNGLNHFRFLFNAPVTPGLVQCRLGIDQIGHPKCHSLQPPRWPHPVSRIVKQKHAKKVIRWCATNGKLDEKLAVCYQILVTTPNISTSEIFMSQKLVVTTLMHMCPPFLRTFYCPSRSDQESVLLVMTLLIFDAMDVMLRLRMDDFKPVNLSMTLWAFARYGIPCVFFRLKSMDTVKRDLLATHMLFNMMILQHESFQKIWFHILAYTGCFFCVLFCPKKKHLLGNMSFFPSCGVLHLDPPRIGKITAD